MAYYAYKNVRDLLPEWIIQEQGSDYQGDANYDGDLWIATSDYIEYLEKKISQLNPGFDFTKRV